MFDELINDFQICRCPRCFPIARAGLADKTPPVHTVFFLFGIEPERS